MLQPRIEKLRSDQPLIEKLRSELVARDIILVELYRHGPFRAEALLKVRDAEYRAIESVASREVAWTQAELDTWLLRDLVDVQLDRMFFLDTLDDSPAEL